MKLIGMEEIESLVRKAKAPDTNMAQKHQAFGELVKRFQDMAYGCAYAILGDFQLAEDAAQEAFINAYRNLAQLRDARAFAGWLKRIVLTQCTRMTRRKSLSTAPLEAALDVPSPEKNPAEVAIKNELKEKVLAAVQALPEKQRMVTMLFYIDGYSQKEIADFLEVPAKTVKSRLHASRKRLKERMTEMVRDNLQEKRPSKDERFANTVQLFNAVEVGQLEKAKELLDKAPELVKAENNSGQTPLHVAAYYGYKEIMELLLANGAEVDVRDNDGRTPLHHMVLLCARPDVAEVLINNGAAINTTDNPGTTPLSIAADYHSMGGIIGDYSALAKFFIDKGATVDIHTATILDMSKKVKALLQTNPELVNARRESGYRSAGTTPLHHAVRNGNTALARMLLKYGADVNAVDKLGYPPLYLIAQFHAPRWKGTRWEMIKLLLAHGGGSRSNHFPELDIFSSSLLGRTDVVIQLLSEVPALINAKDAGGNTPLHLAVWNCQKEMVGLLVAKGADVNAKNNHGRTPINAAGHEDIGKYLLKHGATCDIWTAATLGAVDRLDACLQENPSLLNAPHHEGPTPLQAASQFPDWGTDCSELQGKAEKERPVVEFLLKKGAELDIFTAAQLGKRERIIALLDTEPTLVNNRTSRDLTPLHLAAANGRAVVVTCLIERGASIEAKGQWSQTSLLMAVLHGHIPIVKLLLEYGADINVRDNWNRTPVYTAAWSGRLEVVELLASQGGDIKARDNYNNTPMNVAAEHGHTLVVEFFLEQGMDINDRGLAEYTALHRAARHGHPELARALLERGADVNVRQRQGSTPLYAAAYIGSVEIAELLISHGADVNDKNNLGGTPLHSAAWSGKTEMIEFLLSHGAYTNAKRNDGKTPLQLAMEREFVDAAALLRRRSETE